MEAENERQRYWFLLPGIRSFLVAVICYFTTLAFLLFGPQESGPGFDHIGERLLLLSIAVSFIGLVIGILDIKQKQGHCLTLLGITLNFFYFVVWTWGLFAVVYLGGV